MLKEIFAQRTGSLLAMQHTNEISKRVLGDHTVTSPLAEVIKELSAELTRFKDAHPNWRPDVPDETVGCNPRCRGLRAHAAAAATGL
jgi:hypothetical protein